MAGEGPIGSIIAFGGPVMGNFEERTGWLLCDGRSLDRTADKQKFKPLFDAIGSSWGGDGVNRFNIPDLRGLFLRGVDGGRGKDRDAATREAMNAGGHAGDQVGSYQPDALQAHKHIDQGHAHSATTTVSGSLPTWFSESCEDGSENRVNGNEGTQGNFDPGFSAVTTVHNGRADIGDPTGSTAGAARAAAETRPVNGSVHWIIRWK